MAATVTERVILHRNKPNVWAVNMVVRATTQHIQPQVKANKNPLKGYASVLCPAH